MEKNLPLIERRASSLLVHSLDLTRRIAPTTNMLSYKNNKHPSQKIDGISIENDRTPNSATTTNYQKSSLIASSANKG